jgi:predicted dehydrogenase
MIAAGILAASASASRLVADEPASSRSANDTLQHAVIGCRIRGKVHAKEFGGNPGVAVTHVCDPDSKLANELADAVEKQHGRRPTVFADMRRIFDDKSVDTVSVATPNHWHALAAIWAMQAGKDVYVEKPVSHNVSEGRRMVQVSRKTNRICQGGTQNRSRGDLAAAAKYIREGKLGEIRLARSIIYGNRGSIGARGTYPIPSGVDYDLFVGPAAYGPLTRPTLHYDWHWDWNTGNGELGNNNIHMIDMCRLLLDIKGLGESVISLGGRLGYEDAGDTPNTQMVVHNFEKLTIIQEVRGLKSDPFNTQFRAGAIIYGSEGFIAEGSLFDLQGKLVQTFQGPSQNHFANFLKAVRSRKREDQTADILEGHQSTALCHLGNISYRVGRPETVASIRAELEKRSLNPEVSNTFDRMVDHLRENQIPLSEAKLVLGPMLRIEAGTERLIDHADANTLLTRTYRPPFVVPTEEQI